MKTYLICKTINHQPFYIRAPKILLGPLDLIAIKDSYMKNLCAGEEEASKLACLSKGYGYGYQLLGHLYYERRKIDDELLFEYDKGLRINSYDRIYSSISDSERKVLNTLIDINEKKTSDILLETGFNNKNYSIYRDRLIKKGVVISSRYGYLSLALPRFSEFLKGQIL